MRFDLLSPRPRKQGGTYWHKIGAAFEAKNGGYNLLFDSLPIPDNEGRVSVLMKEATERPQSSDNGQRAAPSSGVPDMDDEIPF